MQVRADELVDGEAPATAAGRAEPFSEWYPLVEAPAEDLVVLDTSGHRPLFEQPDEFVAYLTDVVLPATTS